MPPSCSSPSEDRDHSDEALPGIAYVLSHDGYVFKVPYPTRPGRRPRPDGSHPRGRCRVFPSNRVRSATRNRYRRDSGSVPPVPVLHPMPSSRGDTRPYLRKYPGRTVISHQMANPIAPIRTIPMEVMYNVLTYSSLEGVCAIFRILLYLPFPIPLALDSKPSWSSYAVVSSIPSRSGTNQYRSGLVYDTL